MNKVTFREYPIFSAKEICSRQKGLESTNTPNASCLTRLRVANAPNPSGLSAKEHFDSFRFFQFVSGKVIVWVILCLVFLVGTSCRSTVFSLTANEFLPTLSEVGENPYGAYVFVKLFYGQGASGELIGVEDNRLLILEETKVGKRVVVIPRKEMKAFTLRYAGFSKGDKLVMILTYLSTAAHGYWGIRFTAPFTLVTFLVADSQLFNYKKSDISYEDLKMFARFPQGIPPSFDLSALEE